MLVLPRNLAGVVACAAKNDGRYALAGVRVLDTQDGNYRIEASDGRVALVVRGPCAWNADDGSFERFQDETEEFIVPRDLWQQAFKVLGDGPLLLQGQEKDFVLGNGRGLVDGRQVEGRYPDINQVFPRKDLLASFKVNPNLLATLLKALLPFVTTAASNSYSSPAVTIHVWNAQTVIGLSGHNDAGQYVDALIMPLT